MSAVKGSGGSAAPDALLADATEGVLAVDVAALDDDTLNALIVRLQVERSRLTVAAADLLAEWDARRLWESDGSRSAAHRLARRTHTSVASCREEMGRARRIRGLPVVRDAVIAGHLSGDHLDLLGHVNTPERRHLFERDQSLLASQCERLSFDDGARVVRYWAAHADDELVAGAAHGAADHPTAAGTGAGATAHLGSRVHASRTLDDMLVVDGVFDPIAGSIIEHELSRLAESIRLTDRSAGVARTPAQRRAAAMIDMARRSATTPAGGRAPRPLFTVLVGERTFEQLCELSNNAVTTPHALLPYLGHADIESVLFDGPSTVIAVSRRRTFTGAVRRAIQVRDRRCQHPSGCDIPGDRCDVDHIVAHAAHGPTSQFNGRLQCPAHNRIHHLHDHGTPPQPERPVDRLHQLRVRVRWKHRHAYPHDFDPEPDEPDEPDAERAQ